VQLSLERKHVETMSLSQKMDAIQATNRALKAQVKDLENENCSLDKIASGILDKVNHYNK